MPHHYDYPGVYIEELPAANPIQPVGTSTAAFIGVTDKGPVNQPTFITSFDEFCKTFGETPKDGFYLWYAARGFFENGGQRAYVVRASSGKHAGCALLDNRTVVAERQPTLLVEALELGQPNIQVKVDHTSLVTAAPFQFEAPVKQANAQSDRIQLDDKRDASGALLVSAAELAVHFRPGDRINIKNKTNETVTISQVQGDLLLLTGNLSHKYASPAKVSLSDYQSTDRVLRLNDKAAGLALGSVIQIKESAAKTITRVVRQVQPERITPSLITYRVELEQELGDTFGLSATAVTSQEFTLTISKNGTSEKHDKLSMARTHPRYAPTFVAAEQKLNQDTDPHWQPLAIVREPDIPSNAELADRWPVASTYTLAGGAAEAAQGLTLADYQLALDTLRNVDEVNFIAIPDTTDPAVQLALLAHCTQLADRVAIFDSPYGTPPMGPGSVRDLAGLLQSERGFGALYYPWIKVPHPAGGMISVPPSGHVAGIYARADTEQGVHKAPANYTLNGALGVTMDINNETQGPLNLDGVNVLRVFPGQGRPVVWGARTTSDLTAWQYINIRRLMLFIEESIEKSLRWAVFEPNNLQLWQKLKRVITAFLTSVWRSGALFGAKPEEAFYVTIDKTNNPAEERQLGRLYIEIGICPAYPAEFIIVRIGLWQGGAEISEG